MSFRATMYRSSFKWIGLVMVLCFACRNSGNESTDSDYFGFDLFSEPVDFDLDKIKARGSLVAIVDNSSTGYFIFKGQPMGYEYDLLHRYAQSQDLLLEIKMTTSLEAAFTLLNEGKGDVIAYSLAITQDRKERVAFTDSHFTTRQMLVQRKPEGWRNMTRDEVEKSLIRNQVDLAGKQINLRTSSSFVDRVYNLSEEIGAPILIVEEDSVETEGLIRKVATGEIDYTVADETVASVNASYYPGIDVNTPISFPQQIAWAVRKNAPGLLASLNQWIRQVKREPTFNIIYNKYFNSPRAMKRRISSDFSSTAGDRISIYDELIKAAADSIGWDWRLIASQMYQESQFNPKAKSWAGAVGLMQLVPETGKRFGARNLYDPRQNIFAAVNHMIYLDKLWAKTIENPLERQKFVLASYNVGLGHVQDARNLAKKYGRNPQVWNDNVEYFLFMKSKPEFFRDPVVESGYCRGEEPVNYVNEILSRYNQYKQLINS